MFEICGIKLLLSEMGWIATKDDIGLGLLPSENLIETSGGRKINLFILRNIWLAGAGAGGLVFEGKGSGSISPIERGCVYPEF